jgi:diguanylate cyclase (GGDEF)-like protein
VSRSTLKNPLDSQAEFAWLLGTSQRVDPLVRRELLATIHESRPIALLGSASTGGVALCALVVTQSSWAAAWFILELLILCARLPLLLSLHRLGGSIDSPSFLWLNRITALWFAALGLGALGCLLSGDLMLMVLAVGLLFGFVGALASRLSGVPRLAMFLTCLLIFPALLGLLLEPFPWMIAMAIFLVFYVLVMGLMTTHNHQILRDKIAAEHLNRALLKRDPLTGLSNRRELRSTLQRLKNTPAQPTVCALCLDLDGFKAVNDEFGHPAGDLLLIEVGQRLQRLVREDDLVCRLGGDEFIILLFGASSSDAERKSELIIAELSRPILLDQGQTTQVGVSVGIAMTPDHAESPEELISLADKALYLAKAEGKGTYRMCLTAAGQHII